jgi:polyphosphate kinase
VELAWPVEDATLRQRIISECLTTYLADSVDAWTMGADGHYSLVQSNRPRTADKPKAALGAQGKLMSKYSAKP